MTPYRERREAGHYDPDGSGETRTPSTTSGELAGLGAAQAETAQETKTARPRPANGRRKSSARKTT